MSVTRSVNRDDGGKTLTVLNFCTRCLSRSVTFAPNVRYNPPAVREAPTYQRRTADARVKILDKPKEEGEA